MFVAGCVNEHVRGRAVDIGEPYPLELSDLVGSERSSWAGPMVAWRLNDPRCAADSEAGQGLAPGCIWNFGPRADPQALTLHTGIAPPAAESCNGRLSAPTGCFPEHKHATFSIGPVCTAASGGGRVALLGEIGKFVAVSPDRLASVDCGRIGSAPSKPQVSVVAVGSEGEVVRLAFALACGDGWGVRVAAVAIGADGKGSATCSCAGCAQQQ